MRGSAAYLATIGSGFLGPELVAGLVRYGEGKQCVSGMEQSLLAGFRGGLSFGGIQPFIVGGLGVEKSVYRQTPGGDGWHTEDVYSGRLRLGAGARMSLRGGVGAHVFTDYGIAFPSGEVPYNAIAAGIGLDHDL